MAPVDLVLFDLGGVLIDFGGVEAMAELAGIADPDEVWRRWLSCEWVRSFERGGCSADEFAAGVAADWQLPIDGPAFLAAFTGWVAGALPGADELVAEVGAATRIGCLSNTNPVHWVQWGAWPVLDQLEFRFLSYELGLVKPDRELFDAVAAAVPFKRGRVLFLDDNRINVDGALDAGFQAAVAKGPEGARAVLVERGVLVG
jgi:putative hydrolase of the HAD superfamily